MSPRKREGFMDRTVGRMLDWLIGGMEKISDTGWCWIAVLLFLFCLGMRIYWMVTLKGNPFAD